ncbi:unnamed protein product [Rhizophagus irregularis]|nr:unnamed protein product [Rhizophagus irregularis]
MNFVEYGFKLKRNMIPYISFTKTKVAKSIIILFYLNIFERQDFMICKTQMCDLLRNKFLDLLDFCACNHIIYTI